MKIRIITAAIAGLLTCCPALAGDYATALGECLYKNTTSADKTTLTQWACHTGQKQRHKIHCNHSGGENPGNRPENKESAHETSHIIM